MRPRKVDRWCKTSRTRVKYDKQGKPRIIIVAKAAKAAAPARDALKRVGIKINDALNGVNLPATKGYVGKAVNHLYVHTKGYHEAVNQLLTNVKTREDAVQVLDMIKQSLLDG